MLYVIITENEPFAGAARTASDRRNDMPEKPENRFAAEMFRSSHLLILIVYTVMSAGLTAADVRRMLEIAYYNPAR